MTINYRFGNADAHGAFNSAVAGAARRVGARQDQCGG